jgi:hypothetical protein
VICVDDTTLTEVHTEPPTVTEAPAENPVPVNVNNVPPTAGPENGNTPVTVGGTLDAMLIRIKELSVSPATDE